MKPRQITLGLLLLTIAAFSLRVGLVLVLARGEARPFAYEHGEIAENLVNGRGFTVRYLGQEGPTSQQAPLYPWALAGLYRMFGAGSSTALLTMQLIQCAAGAGLALAVTWLGWSLLPANRAVGWIAGWGAALYPPHIYMVTHIQVALWAALLLTLTAAVVLSPRRRGTIHGAALAGVLGGLLLLVEPILALALPVLALAMLLLNWANLIGPRRWPWLKKHAAVHFRVLGGTEQPQLGNTAERSSVCVNKTCGSWMQLLRPAILPATFALVALAVVTPWLWRNYRVHGEFVFIKSSFGYALWQGNNESSWGTDKIPKPEAAEMLAAHDGTLAGANAAMWKARHETLYIDDVLLAPTGYREFVGLSEPARSRLLGARAYQFIGEHPGQYGRLCLQRLRYFLLWDETNPKAANPIYRASTLAWLGLSLAGLALAGNRWRTIWPTVAIFAAIALFHTLTIVSARFRIPVEPLSFVWAGMAVATLVGWLRRKPVTAATTDVGEPIVGHQDSARPQATCP